MRIPSIIIPGRSGTIPICWKVGTTMWSIWRIISIRMPMLASFASIRRPILSRNGLRHFLSLQQGANRRLYWLAGSGYGSHAALDGSGTESAYSDYGPSRGKNLVRCSKFRNESPPPGPVPGGGDSMRRSLLLTSNVLFPPPIQQNIGQHQQRHCADHNPVHGGSGTRSPKK